MRPFEIISFLFCGPVYPHALDASVAIGHESGGKLSALLTHSDTPQIGGKDAEMAPELAQKAVRNTAHLTCDRISACASGSACRC